MEVQEASEKAIQRASDGQSKELLKGRSRNFRREVEVTLNGKLKGLPKENSMKHRWTSGGGMSMDFRREDQGTSEGYFKEIPKGISKNSRRAIQETSESSSIKFRREVQGTS